MLFVDLSTAFGELGRHAHGTTRLERGLVGALASLGDPSLAFCRYNRFAGCFETVARDQAVAIATAPTRGEAERTPGGAWRKHVLLAPGRRLERWVYERIGRPLQRRFAPLARRSTPAIVATRLAAGDTLLLPGELQRHDFAHLLALKRAGVRLAFVFYDLLGVLADGDPRLADPDATDIPGADFVLRHADAVLAISQFSADELAKLAHRRGLALPPLSVLRLGFTAFGASGPPVAVAGLAPGGFVLTVGSIGWRKNQRMLAEVWRELRSPPPLVMAGGVEADEVAFMRRVETDPSFRGRVRVLANVDDAELWWLYQNCRFTVFASLEEGFGLPVAESLACGKVCVASNAMSIPEAGQGLAISLDPTDAAGWRAVVQRLIDDDAELAAREAEVGAKFRAWTWNDTAADVLAALAPLLGAA